MSFYPCYPCFWQGFFYKILSQTSNPSHQKISQSTIGDVVKMHAMIDPWSIDFLQNPKTRKTVRGELVEPPLFSYPSTGSGRTQNLVLQ
ncbi:hypothetical protein [Moraxella sp.]|uniref:hypothetical protein n=1 Tax=Moraxella sp. TaxID=479 RepID=UPI0026DC5A9C|nr:hypothetical protein [Moraxella sp.]MDO4893987.1 hypothetical protein [Moraxella sp.]